MKLGQDGRIVSVAVIVAIGVNTDGRREVPGMDVGPSEAETFRTAFPRKLARRGLRGVKLDSTNPLERPNGEIKRRTEVVGMFASRPFGSPTRPRSRVSSGRSCSSRTTCMDRPAVPLDPPGKHPPDRR